MKGADGAVGIDACTYGWFVTVLTEDSIETKLYEDFSDVQTDHQAARIFVDISVGIPTTSRRRCDIEARALLGCRRNSVFFPPCESTAVIEDYDEANAKHREEMGHRLSQQGHAISDKIISSSGRVWIEPLLVRTQTE